MDLVTAPSPVHAALAPVSHLAVAVAAPLPPPRPGTLHLTPHHSIWRHTGGDDELRIPHLLLASLDHVPPTPTLRHAVVLRTRTFAAYRLAFESAADRDGVWDSLRALVHARTPADAYAHAHPPATPRRRVYDPAAEFARMRVGPAWRLSDVNAAYEFCSTYPTPLLVPSRISDTTLTYAVKYRSKGRLPVGCYIHWANGASLTRASQPMKGFLGARSLQDEALLEAVFHSHNLHTGARSPSTNSPLLPTTTSPRRNTSPGPSTVVYGSTASNVIIDARPTTNATANNLKGAGSENMEHYRSSKKVYLGIDNIHVMRLSLTSLTALLRASTLSTPFQPPPFAALLKTGWLKHLAGILDGVAQIVTTVHVRSSHVFVHCSDGWDRTSQLCSLAALCLDPYYRTVRGFATLIEKDWASFGHRFAQRSGIHVDGKEMVSFGDRTNWDEDEVDGTATAGGGGAWVNSFKEQLSIATGGSGKSHAYKEHSPVFAQFLDCTFQLLHQFPDRFEFDERLLKMLHEHSLSGECGDFLFNSECERREQVNVLPSVWDLIFDQVESEWIVKKMWLNRLGSYNVKLDDRSGKGDQGVLLPDCRNVRFWWQLFGLREEEMSAPPKVEEDEVVALSSSFGSDVNVRGSKEWGDVGDDIDRGRLKQPAPTTTTPAHLTAPLPSFSTSMFGTSTPTAPSPSRSPLQPQSTLTSPQQDRFVTQSTSSDQLQQTIETVRSVGWSTWGKLKRGYEDARRDFMTNPNHSTTSEPQEVTSPKLPNSSLPKSIPSPSNVNHSGGGGWSNTTTTSNPWSLSESTFEDLGSRQQDRERRLKRNVVVESPSVSSSVDPLASDPLGVGL